MRLFALAALVVIAGCGAGRSPESTQVAPQSAPRAIPQSVGAFKVVSVAPVRGAPTDTLYRFRDSTGFGISVFRYSISDDVRQGGDTLQWLTTEGDKFPKVHALMRNGGIVDSFKVRMARMNPARAAFPAEYVSAIQTWSRRGVFIELEYLYIIDGRFLKVRGSEPDREDGSSPTAQFARALIGRMESGAK